MIAVFVGGAVGGGLRFQAMAWLSRPDTPWVRHWSGPWSTQVVNLSGSLAMGILAGLSPAMFSTPWMLLGAGLLGSYTTVSAFSLDILQLLRTGGRRQAALHIGMSVIGCPLLAMIGFWGISAVGP